MVYRPRVIDAAVERSLGAVGAVLIEGVRACGKTETGAHHSRSVVRFDTDDAARELAELAPERVLRGAVPRLLDEWQLVPKIWNHVRRAVDDRKAPGQFILAGSARPADDVTRHSGAGRILRLRMRPMSLLESGRSTGGVSLKALVDGGIADGVSLLEISDLADVLCLGGWPGLQRMTPDAAQDVLRSYLDDVARVDMPALDGRQRDSARIRRVLAAYARHVATPAAIRTITADAMGADRPEGESVHPTTTSDYLTVLERVMVVEEQKSWGPHLRSRDVVRKASIRHFVDPSLAVAAMGGSPDRLLGDPRAFGLLFESLVIRDLRVYTQPFDGEVLHYRDAAGAEADAIIQLRDGRWAAIEVKLGESRVEEAVTSLERLVAKIDTARAGEPVARIVITGGRYAYTRPDGVHVVPLGCLAP